MKNNIFLSTIFLVLIGCGGSKVSSTVESFEVIRTVDGNVTEVTTSLKFTLQDTIPKNITYENFEITKLSCKENDYNSSFYDYSFSPTSLVLNMDAPENQTLINIKNIEPVCSDVKYFNISVDEKKEYDEITNIGTKIKRINLTVYNPNYGYSLTLEDKFDSNSIIEYNNSLVNSEVSVVVFESDYNNTNYVNNGNIAYFANTLFKETNASNGDWILVNDTNIENDISFRITDINYTDTNRLVVDEKLNSSKLNTDSYYNVLIALSKCNFEYESSKLGYSCEENNLSKIYIIEYNETDAVYKRLDSF
ncbi:hypothetical protein RZR97_06865 [Hydrogenimonas thermophila]|uniref:hypothetical protein n=1 Tax=Hydrogenimonas thermophila TaxID=223786 RepID=UPI0029370B06|nr:hypothetical protein [Hydrogenimonas thermophila]WOE68835.1 hypothetical protein RZR91_06895 [Hydrogenimonas thermophila]WOE71343.1 hypothetical protein RZR97_06865 [Hydrogenimonas thermophila]